MSASGCASKCVASSASRSLIWRLSSAMMPDRSAGAGPERGGDRGGRGELLGAQHGLNLLCPGVEVALAPSGFERRPDLRQAQPRGVGGGRGAAQDGQRVAVGQIVERLQRRGVVLPQRASADALVCRVRAQIRF